MYLLLTILAVVGCLGDKAEGAEQTVLSRASLSPTSSQNPYGMVWPTSGIRFSPGDSVHWRLPDYDDAHWLRVERKDTYLEPERARGIGWTGLGWFRLHVDVAEDAVGLSVAIAVAQLGASELYVDGIPLVSLGRVGVDRETEEIQVLSQGRPRIVPHVFETAGPHVIAVRYSNFFGWGNKGLGFPAGFWLVFYELENALVQGASIGRAVTVNQMLCVVPLAFAILHLLLYAFRRKARGHLDYAAFAGSMALLVYAPFQGAAHSNPWAIYGFIMAFKASLVLAGVTGIRFLNTLYLGRPSRIFRVASILGGLLILGVYFLPTSVYFVFSVACYPEMLRSVVRGIRQRQNGALIIGAGAVIFTVACVFQVLMELGIIVRADLDIFFPYIYGVLALVVSMSIQLARSFATANRDLAAQLEQVRVLSDHALEQRRQAHERDRKAQEEEASRRVLEADTAAKAKEIEEARRRQEALEALEETNQELERTQDQLVQTEKMAALGNLVAGIAHEINTPVGAINSMHDTLIRAVDRLNGELKAAVGVQVESDRALRASLDAISEANAVIATGCQRVTEIVRSLRSFARLDEAEMKRADLHDCIDSTLTLVYHEIKNRIQIEKDYGSIPQIVCYPSRLNQVFLNMLVNAAHAMPEAGSICVATRMEDRYAVVEISDEGVGIAPDDVGRIFDPGFTTKGVGVGTGLGLSICYQIVSDHRGRIEVDSEVGVGTTFRIYLPVDPDEPKESDG